MPSFDVAHIREQGQNMLLFPLNSNFGHKSSADQHTILGELQAHARGAGLAGQAVAIWESDGSTHTIGPKQWQGFLRSIDLRFVLANVNKSVSW